MVKIYFQILTGAALCGSCFGQGISKPSAVKILTAQFENWNDKVLEFDVQKPSDRFDVEKHRIEQIIGGLTKQRFNQINVDENLKPLTGLQWISYIYADGKINQFSFWPDQDVDNFQKGFDRLITKPFLKSVGAEDKAGGPGNSQFRIIGISDDLFYYKQLDNSEFFESSTTDNWNTIVFDNDESTRVQIIFDGNYKHLLKSSKSFAKPGGSGWNPDVESIELTADDDSLKSYKFIVRFTNGKADLVTNVKVLGIRKRDPDKDYFAFERTVGSRYTDMQTGETFKIENGGKKIVKSLTKERKLQDEHRPGGWILMVGIAAVGAGTAVFLSRKRRV